MKENAIPHNPEVVGSSPASATIINTGFRKKSGVFLLFEDMQRKQMEHCGNGLLFLYCFSARQPF